MAVPGHAVGQDFVLVEGEHHDYVYTPMERDEAGNITGPMDMTGSVVRWQSGTLVKTLGDGITATAPPVTVPPSPWRVVVHFLPANTNGAVLRKGHEYELRATDAAGKVSTLATGRYIVEPTRITA